MSAVRSGRRQLARFELLRELGRGAQATVWLANDPRLDREVALKLLSGDADATTRHEWMNEARAVSRLKHPNVVPVFEADEHEGQPYLVFEYVEGPTLQELRRKQPSMPAREAVTLMLGVLDALVAAHEDGIVHRDLKPSNILLGGDGRPRVMDFGIAARIVQPSGKQARGTQWEAGLVVGTPGYMSPEAARGEAPLPAMDVFSAGVMLGELLSGAPLLRESDPYRAIARIQNEDLVLPASVKIDDTLRSIVQRALARQTDQRYDSAKALHAALSAWLTPTLVKPKVDVDVGHATLDFLLRRMRSKTDFPALSGSVVRIQRIALSETESLASLSEEVLKDVALTKKLLRMVNTAHFTSVAGVGISTVSRAVALVGFAGIRNMALSVILLEHMGDKGHAGLLKEEFLRALMAGTLASELSAGSRESEEAFLAAMFQNLGRLLIEYYFQEEALQIRQRMAGKPATHEVRESAAHQVLGLGMDDLGAGVARAWGLPDTLQRALRVPDGDIPPRPVSPHADSGVERLRWLARSANALTDAMLSADGEQQTAALESVAEAYAHALSLQPRDLLEGALKARTRVADLAKAMGLHIAAGAPAQRLLQVTAMKPAAAAGPAQAATGAATDPDAKTLVGVSADAAAASTSPTAGGGDGPTIATGNPLSAAQVTLAQGLEALQQAMAQGSMRLNEILHLVLQTLQQSLSLRSVVLCLRDPKSGLLIGRVAMGHGPADVASAFRIAPDNTSSQDLFAAICAKGADLLIADTQTVAKRLPAWYGQKVKGATFLLLPMMVKGQAIGLIYADRAEAGTLKVSEAELALLRSLRDQTVLAMSKGSA